MIVNGKQVELAQPMSLADFLLQSDYRLDLVAVELDGAIVKSSEYPRIQLEPNSTLEVVSFVGGG